MSFSPVPAGHRRLIEHLSCFHTVPATGTLRYVALLATSYAAAPRDFFAPTRSLTNTTYLINSPTQQIYEAGETPQIYALSDGAPISDMQCSVAGRDITLP